MEEIAKRKKVLLRAPVSPINDWKVSSNMKGFTSIFQSSSEGVGNPCRTWHAYTFYPAREQGLRNKILPLSNEKNNNLQIAVLLNEGLEIPSLLIMFLLTIRQLSQKLMHILFN